LPNNTVLNFDNVEIEMVIIFLIYAPYLAL